MRRSLGTILFGLACALALAGCKTDAESRPEPSESSPCVKQCEAAFNACSTRCMNDVDNEMCGDECVDALDHCKRRCP